MRTRLSSERAGHLHYTIKRDMRRDGDRERRREGHDYFYPIIAHNLGNQPWPQNQPDPPDTPLPITLIHESKSPTGRRALVVGTETDLYCFYPDMNGEPYYDPGDTPDDQYIDEWYPSVYADYTGTHWPEPRPTDGDPPAPIDTGGIPATDGGGQTPPPEDVEELPPTDTGDGLMPIPTDFPGGSVVYSDDTDPDITAPAGYEAVWIEGIYFAIPPDAATTTLVQMEKMARDVWERLVEMAADYPGSRVRSEITMNATENRPGAQYNIVNWMSDQQVLKDGHPNWTLTTYFLKPV